MNSFNHPVSVLEGNNIFPYWKIQIEVYLQGLGVWGCVNRTRLKPADNTDNKTDIWEKDDAKAKSAIFQTLNMEQIMQVAEKKTSKEVFEQLKSLYSNISKYSKMNTLTQYHAFQMLKTEAPTSAFNRLTTITRALKVLGQTIDDKDFIAKMVSVVPLEKYAPFRMAWDSVEDTRHTIEYLYTRLQNYELMYTVVENTPDEPASSFYAGQQQGNRRGNFRSRGGRGNSRGGGGGGGRNGYWGKEKRCFNSPDHLIRDCDQPRPENDNGDRNSKNGTEGGYGYDNGNGSGNGYSNRNGNETEMVVTPGTAMVTEVVSAMEMAMPVDGDQQTPRAHFQDHTMRKLSKEGATNMTKATTSRTHFLQQTCLCQMRLSKVHGGSSSILMILTLTVSIMMH